MSMNKKRLLLTTLFPMLTVGGVAAQQSEEIETLESSIEIDEQLIDLQQEVVNTSESQLKNGIITTSEYITELTKLYEAENLFNQHKTQLELAKANYNTLKGDSK